MNRISNNEIQIEFSIKGSRMGLFNIEWNLPCFPNIGDKIEFLDEFLDDADKFNIYQLYTASNEYSYLEGAKNVEDQNVAIFYNYLCPFQVKSIGWRKDKFGIYPCLVLESCTNKREESKDYILSLMGDFILQIGESNYDGAEKQFEKNKVLLSLIGIVLKDICKEEKIEHINSYKKGNPNMKSVFDYISQYVDGKVLICDFIDFACLLSNGIEPNKALSSKNE